MPAASATMRAQIIALCVATTVARTEGRPIDSDHESMVSELARVLPRRGGDGVWDGYVCEQTSVNSVNDDEFRGKIIGRTQSPPGRAPEIGCQNTGMRVRSG